MGADRETEIALCVFREANDALVIFDPRDRRVVDVNPTTLRLTRFERKAILSLQISDLVTSPEPNDFRRLLAACLTTGFFHAQEGFLLARLEGPPIPVNVSVSRIHTRPDPLGLAIIRDVSGRVKLEAQLREAHDSLESRVIARTAELAEANRAMHVEIQERLRVEAELRRAKEAAEEAGRVKDRFLAVLSHELRTPLTPVLAVVSALLDGPGAPPDFRPTLEMIRRSVSLEARLIDDLLDAMRGARGELRLEPRSVDALELIGQAVGTCEPGASAIGARISVEPKARNHRIMADPTRFLQVVWGLLQNAVKFVGPRGTIIVSTADGPAGRLAVSVADDGRGIGPDLLGRIFEPFDQGESPMLRRPEGLGLGLAICRSIVEGHGGRIAAASEGHGRGSAFTFDMPLASATAPGSESPSIVAPEALATLDILLVEDNKDVLRYLKMVLEMKGHRVRAAADLAGARRALEHRFDLLISDIELPDGSGLDLMREVRGRMPGIAVSGFGAPDDVSLSLDAGFALHLTKPIETRRLDLAIAQAVGLAEIS